MKVGFYKDELSDVDGDNVEDVAEAFADENHQVDEKSDMEFTVYVEDDSGKLFIVEMYTEYDPSYYVKSAGVEM